MNPEQTADAKAIVNKMMILGNRVLVSKLEEPKQEGFETVSPTDSFLYKGVIELSNVLGDTPLKPGATILFAKYSPDTHEIDVDGEKMKIINVDDILAIYE